jgi:hypothetical protein
VSIIYFISLSLFLSAFLPFSGVQQNYAVNSLSSGWSSCYNGTYDELWNSTIVQNILNTCNKSKLLMGCRRTSSGILLLAAAGRREDVLFDCGSLTKCVHVANGVGWYFSDNFSWGFVAGGDSVNRNECDAGRFTNALIAV